jgi:DNA-binding transcriptional ArsR family regulator
MSASGDPTTNSLFVALAHPLRRRILRHMVEVGDEISPREIAEALNQPLSRLSYHVTVLAQCRAIELAGTAPVRGSTQHFYRAAVDARWALMALEACVERTGRGRR